MLRVGIVGLGFMGSAHFNIYKSLPDHARVAGIVDVDPKKREGDWSAIGGNIDVGGAKPDLDGVVMHEKIDTLLADPGIDVVDITLPTYLHADAAVRALEAGKHVFCEKPMAIDSAEAFRMAEAARKSGKRLFVGQCIRFWPAYALAAEIIRDGRYGAVRSARFQRHSTLPTWSWENWLQDNNKSGLAALDLHIHDADFVLYAFGRPKSLTCRGLRRAGGGYDHLVSCYHYDDGKLVMAEGAWEYAPAYPFAMIFSLHFERGSLLMNADGALTFYPIEGGQQPLSVPEGSGYDHELRHFLDCIESGKESPVINPESAAESVRLIEKEIESAEKNATVEF